MVELAATVGSDGHFFGSRGGAAPFPANAGIWNSDGVDQQLGVGVFGVLNDPINGAGLHQGAAVENINIIADLIGGREIMGDVEEGNAIFFLEIAEDV